MRVEGRPHCPVRIIKLHPQAQVSAEGTPRAARVLEPKEGISSETESSTPQKPLLSFQPHLTGSFMWEESNLPANGFKMLLSFPIIYFNYSVNINWNSTVQL